MKQTLKPSACAFFAALALSQPLAAAAAVYSCTDVAGKTVYTAEANGGCKSESLRGISSYKGGEYRLESSSDKPAKARKSKAKPKADKPKKAKKTAGNAEKSDRPSEKGRGFRTFSSKK
ncbi:DUF4124 domain-containing protein [Neisseria chenwenguii]|uniref:DUF4124 domain-containing protein n=1 Tax=Neisseria chenwenguii TaxID=1853278 RepID=A0A220S439_9NEIS|nr:DUF4124 domain-containing protein [Neisseria chenwenguii]ASK28264.1 hypothetical protein BG910_11445 [Neisseria chenwenguii]ROV57389.1 DUF4124 domain-containing protein [Neisseria chenwenguii]